MTRFYLVTLVLLTSLYLNGQCNRQRDSLALVAIYKSTNGPNWINKWDITTPIDTWFGVRVMDNCVVALDLDGNPDFFQWGVKMGNNLTGKLPEQIGDLTSLNQLFLSNNNIEGEIPTSITKLKKLAKLDLFKNQMSGTIPENIGDLSQLDFLSLSSNVLEGTIPKSIGMLSKLQFLLLEENNLQGVIPETIGNLSNLEQISVSFNNLEGQIPNDLGQLKKLNSISFTSNRLEGCFPEELRQFCGKNVNFGGNRGLAWEGNFQIFCGESSQLDAPCNNAHESLTGHINNNCECQLPLEINTINIQPLVVSRNESFQVYIELNTSDYDSIELSGISSARAVIDGENKDRIILKDNGEGQDAVKGDHIYTSSSVQWDWSPIDNNKIVASDVIIFSGDITTYKDNNSSVFREISIGLGVRLADTNFIKNPSLTIVDTGFQHSSHVINLVVPKQFQNPPSGDQAPNKKLKRILGEYFCDDNNELIFGYAHSTPNKGSAASYRSFNNEVENICLGPKDFSFFKAEGLTLMHYGNMSPTLFVHEYLHRYAGHCRELDFVTSGGHWGPIDFPIQGFFASTTDFTEVSPGIYSVEEVWRGRQYNELEMYYLGLGSIDDIPWPLKFIKDAKNIGRDMTSTEFRILYEGQLATMDKEEFLAKHGGLRIPLSEPNILKSSLVVFSHRLLTPKEMAYYQHQMEVFEMESITREIENIYFATAGKLKHITKLRQIEQIDTVFLVTNDTVFNLPNGVTLTANDQGLTSFYTESNPEPENCDKRILYTVEVNYTDKDNDGYTSDIDCNDNNANINPNMEEIANNGIDEDCDGMDLITLQDQDGDGFLENVDCDDTNASINPSMEEIANSGVDENCDGESLIIDEDGDGWNSSIDCDDTNASINEGAIEIPNNGIDEDCNGEDLINTSIHELGSKVINIYPNPFNDNFVVDIEGDYKNLRLKITTINGQIIHNSELIKWNLINLSNQSAGTYLIEIMDLGLNKKIIDKVIKIK